MTEQEALEVARKQIRAENAAYMREWRKRNPEKDRAIRNRYREKLKAKRKEGKSRAIHPEWVQSILYFTNSQISRREKEKCSFFAF